MRLQLLLLLIFTLSLRAHGDSRFQKLYGDTLDDDLVRITKTSTGDYLLLGTVDIFNAGPRKADIALYRTNVFGDLLYSYLIGDTSTNVPTDMLENPDGTCTVCGYINDRQQDLSSRDFFLLRMDDAGSILWENTYGLAGVSDQATSMTRSTDNSVYLAGSSDDHGLVCKVDEFGQVLWSYRMDSFPGANQSHFNCITPTFDGGCVAAGWWTASFPPGVLFTQDLAARFSSSGQVLWIRSVGDPANVGRARDITFLPDGGFLVTGGHDNGGTPVQSLYKLNANGTLAWSLALESPGGYMTGSAVFYADNGTILAGGASNPSGTYTASLIMTDSTGTLQHQWNYAMGGIHQIVDALDGDFLLCGRYDGSPFNTDGYLIKTNDTGYTGCSEAAAAFTSSTLNYSSTPAGQALACTLDQGFAVMLADPYVNQFGQLCSWIGMDETFAPDEPSLYPNPSNGTVLFRYTHPGPVRGELLDLQGRIVKRFSYEGSGEFLLPTSTLADGCYLVRGEGFSPMRLIIRR